MTMRLVRKAFLVFAAFLFVFFCVRHFTQKAPSDSSPSLPLIAITQVVEHLSLDEEREGIIKALSDAGYIDGKTVKILYRNAQGNLGTAAQIIAQMISQKPIVVIAISTPSAQTALALCLAKKIPLIFTAVTDPIEAKLIPDPVKKTDPITGVSDNIPVDSQIQLILDALPHLKTLGVIYNPGEVNSLSIVKNLKESALKYGIKIIEATGSRTSDASAAMNGLVGKVDAVYIPNDNTAVSAIQSILQIGERHRLPVFAGDIGSVKAGAVAMRGYDRHQLGEKAGKLAVRILKGENPASLPVLTNHLLETVVNKEAAEKMGLVFPNSIHKKILTQGTDKP